MRILLTLSYDGTNYAGWQRQENAITIQQSLEESLEAVFGQKVKTMGAGRTDAGVHALAQRALLTRLETKIPIKKLPSVINGFLDNDIVVNNAELVEDNFCPIACAKSKTYEYSIYNADFINPLMRNYCYFTNKNLNVSAMAEAGNFFVGEHDFCAFRSSGGSAKTTVRTIYALEVKKENRIIKISVKGSGFLYNMVRIISGTLLEVGDGKIKPEDITAIILSKDRKMAGKTLPSCGLLLKEIKY